MSEAAEFLTYYSRIRERTLRAATCIPDADIEWTYQAGKFTFGDQLRHLAGTERLMFAENARGNPGRYTGHDTSLASGKDGVMDYMARLHAESVEIIGGLSDARFTERCTTPGGIDIPVWKWLRAMIEHEVHHRAQIHLMLSMRGVTPPPLYGLTAEEVIERSKPL